jgi:cytochrome P450
LVVLSAVLRRFRLSMADGRTVPNLPRITLAPARPLRMRLERR